MKEHRTELRVRYKETDQMGVMYYSNYLVWFEVGRTEFFRHEGVVYRDLEQTHKVYLPVTEAHCRYKAPLRYDDKAVVVTRLAETGRSRMTFEYQVLKGGEEVTTGYTRHAFVSSKGRPVKIPDFIRNSFSV
ncbi:MAG: YbgC/FadM family acyl-CoA thioesterase [Candidatus Omnitrophica bacterium]|nr:YbgC/FadM family acyl-CoA thioesterase [Candidatus Omnitrophota bacterium]